MIVDIDNIYIASRVDKVLMYCCRNILKKNMKKVFFWHLSIRFSSRISKSFRDITVKTWQEVSICFICDWSLQVIWKKHFSFVTFLFSHSLLLLNLIIKSQNNLKFLPNVYYIVVNITYKFHVSCSFLRRIFANF